MVKKTKLFKSKERKNRADVSAFLHQMADKLAAGEVVFRRGSEELSVAIPEYVLLEVQVDDKPRRAKGMEHQLEIEIKWYDQEMGGPLELG